MVPPAAPETKEIFLSYSRNDREACLTLRLALEQAGLKVFQDEDAIRVGDRWVTRLEDALQRCSAFVLLVGRDGVQRWVGAEVQVALIRHLSPRDDAQRLPIFPVLLEGASPEALRPFLALFQSARWSPTEPLPDALLEVITTHVPRFDYSPFEGCPFLGLSAFGRGDARLFFGRRKETLQALASLGDQEQTNPEYVDRGSGDRYFRWLQIEGNSGSGKSSLVNAGMLPMIEQGALWARTGFDHWRILGPIMPGREPVASLADALEHGLIAEETQRDSLKLQKRLEEDERALARRLRDFKEEQGAFLLVVDQFEELFTFTNDVPRKRFDVLLSYALQDPDCPLFLISTVRTDFLERFEWLPCLQAIFNTHCMRYFLPTISEHSLREIIEQPARLAGLDVSEVTIAILNDARDEIGALPLVENALFTLWQYREDNRLSGDRYRQENGIAGMLSTQADALLGYIDGTVPKGRQAALELLLRLTRINDEGRHTRQRISREEAVMVAGGGDRQAHLPSLKHKYLGLLAPLHAYKWTKRLNLLDPERKIRLGEHVVQLLSGERMLEVLSAPRKTGALRLITTSTEQEGKSDVQYVDLIHETLVRARSRDEKTGKRIGYWPTLYNYIEANRDRDIHRQQLKLQTQRWLQSKGLGRWWNLAGWHDLWLYRPLRTPKDSLEGHFLFWSYWAAHGLMLLLMLVFGFVGESYLWTRKHGLPLDSMLTLQRYRLGYAPVPELVAIPAGSFDMGEQDTEFLKQVPEQSMRHFGVPGRHVEIKQGFTLGKYETTYEQFDYYVWEQQRAGHVEVVYPTTAKGGRGTRPVVNVTWNEMMAYAKWLDERTHQHCRLPTEAEWEYAARAKTKTAYSWGDEIGQNRANCNGCGSPWDNDQSAPVGSFPANAFGLHDMSGNVWEWTCSLWRDRFDGNEQLCADRNEKGDRVVRGGSWNSEPASVRSAVRDLLTPNSPHGISFGFRVLCSIPIE